MRSSGVEDRAGYNPITVRAILVALIVLLLNAGAAAEVPGDLLRGLNLSPLGGRPAPPFTLDAVNGPRTSLSDFRGQALLLYFWASW